MSRAGKFIPGGGSKGGKRTGPIRAPEPEGPPGTPSTGGKKRLLGKGSLVKPVSKNQRMPIVVMSACVLALLVSAGWYFMAYMPQKREAAALRAQIAADQAKQAQDEADRKRKEDAAAAAAAAIKGVLIVDTNPTGAKVIIGDFARTTPAKFESLVPGPVTVLIQADGYEDFKTTVTINGDKPLDMDTVQLVPRTGDLTLSSPQGDVTYTVTGPNGYTHDGQVPDKLEKLLIGDYTVAAAQKDWKLPPISISIHDHDSVMQNIKFPYAKLAVTSTPPGATVREGRNVLGVTPLNLSQLRPKLFHLSVDLPPYTVQRIDVRVPDFGMVTKDVKLATDKSFVAACGMPMEWIAEGGYWAGKYEVRQGEFEKVAGYNPSQFRGTNRPVESVSWESAQAFVDKLNKFEAKAGKIPNGFHYSLPRESQWDQYNADASLDTAATSRVTPLNSTQDAGYSDPNKYGLYDTLGNVWEWCLDDYDDKGNHPLRGGTWLSLPDNFAGAETRQGAPAKYADKFIGFRVVLTPNS